MNSIFIHISQYNREPFRTQNKNNERIFWTIMSFFNLTALGPQNIFRQNQIFLHLFTSDDLKQSFNNFVKDETCTRKGEEGNVNTILGY